jgi:hypothetical protein
MATASFAPAATDEADKTARAAATITTKVEGLKIGKTLIPDLSLSSNGFATEHQGIIPFEDIQELSIIAQIAGKTPVGREGETPSTHIRPK